MKLTPSGVLKFAQETVNTPRIDDLGRKIHDKVGYIEFPDKTRTYGLLDTFMKIENRVVEGYEPDRIVDFTI